MWLPDWKPQKWLKKNNPIYWIGCKVNCQNTATFSTASFRNIKYWLQLKNLNFCCWVFIPDYCKKLPDQVCVYIYIHTNTYIFYNRNSLSLSLCHTDYTPITYTITHTQSFSLWKRVEIVSITENSCSMVPAKSW